MLSGIEIFIFFASDHLKGKLLVNLSIKCECNHIQNFKNTESVHTLSILPLRHQLPSWLALVLDFE